MKLKKINEEHYVVVDETEIKEGDCVFNDYNKTIVKFSAGRGIGLCKKITHSTQPLDKSLFFTDRVWGCERLSLGEVKELLGEVDVDKKEIILTDSQKELLKMGSVFYKDSSVIYYLPYIIINENNKWYIQLEDNKEKKYTEEDLLLFSAEIIGKFKLGIIKEVEDVNTIIQSLQPKTEWEVKEITPEGKIILL